MNSAILSYTPWMLFLVLMCCLFLLPLQQFLLTYLQVHRIFFLCYVNFANKAVIEFLLSVILFLKFLSYLFDSFYSFHFPAEILYLFMNSHFPLNYLIYFLVILNSLRIDSSGSSPGLVLLLFISWKFVWFFFLMSMYVRVNIFTVCSS